MSFPPDIYLIGAQKSGTTTLAYLLCQHPNICKCKRKEPHFFTHNWYRGLPWYQDLFPNYEDTVCLDASTSYSMAPLSLQEKSNSSKKHKGVPQRLYSVNPNARFIYLLRDPVERTYSGYWHRVAAGREHKSFGKAIRDNPSYLDVSNYYGQLAVWLEYFPIESFLFVLFEELKENPEQVVKACFKFIGLDPESVQVSLEEAKNSSAYVNIVGRSFNRLFKALDHSGFNYVVPPYVRGAIQKATRDYTKKYPKMQEKDREFLREYFSEKKHNLESLIGLSLNHWQA